MPRGMVCAWWACVVEETATPADGKHPTGMHPCFHFFSDKLIELSLVL